MASKSARKRRKRRPPPRPEPAGEPERAEAEPQPARPSRSSRLDDAPPAPWGNFPLIELSVLLGLVFLVAGFFFVEGER